jgi:alpha-L-fucosidase 2
MKSTFGIWAAVIFWAQVDGQTTAAPGDGSQPFPVFNPETGKVEKPDIPARKTFYRDVVVRALPAEGFVAKDKVIDWSTAMADDGAAMVVTGSAVGPGRPLTLWYRRPATRWTEASVIGNGRLGGLVWGRVSKERVDLNEDTLWSGEPYDNINTNGLKSLPEIRGLLLTGKNSEAQRLVERDMNGHFNESYQPLGDLTLDFPISGEVTEYRRELDLEEAVARVQFEHEGVRYTREIFASNPAQAIIVRLASDKPRIT